MGITNWFMQRNMRNVARKLAKKVAPLYADSKSRNPNATDAEVVLDIAFNMFNKEDLTRTPESSMKRIKMCCETIQGFCYMMALDVGVLKGLMNLRSLQFTHYMDKELEAQGFTPQTKKQKERILKVMELRIPGWDRISGDADDVMRVRSDEKTSNENRKREKTLGASDKVLSELERFTEIREELGIEDNNYIIVARNISKYYLELVSNYKDRFRDELTLLLTAGILDAQHYIFIEKSIDISEIHEMAGNSLDSTFPLVKFIIALGIIMFKIDSPEFTIGEVIDAWGSQREQVEKEVNDILKLYERDSLISEATKVFMESPKFKSLRKQIGIL